MARMTLYLLEFFELYTINLLNLISPGAGFAIMIRNSSFHSRKVGVFTAFGIVTSSLIHKSYTLLGFGLLVSETAWLFYTIKYAGAAYLFYLGAKTLNVHKINNIFRQKKPKDLVPLTSWGGFRVGFLVDLLNPSASLSFVCIVVATVSIDTPIEIRGLYGITLILTSLAWYLILAFSFSNKTLQNFIMKSHGWVERIMGASLIYLSIRMLSLIPKCGG